MSIPETKEARVTVNTQYDPEVGRPKKRPEDKYVTPARSFRPPPELWEKARATAAENGETITDVLVRALRDYVKGKR